VIGSRKGIYLSDAFLCTRRIHVAANTTKLASLTGLAPKIQQSLSIDDHTLAFTMLGYHMVPTLRSDNNVPGLGQPFVAERYTSLILVLLIESPRTR
jgi:hypothetical protein